MSNDFDSYPQEEERPQGPRPGRILFILVAVLVIIGLLGSAIAGLAWFILSRTSDTAAIQSATEVVERTAEATVGPTSEAPTVAPAATETPATGVINRIVLVNDDGQIETIAPDGSNDRALTNAAQTFQFPAWSPNGEYLAAVGGDAVGSAVYVLPDEESAELQRLYFSRSQSPFYLYWSPDSHTVSFLANHPSEGIGLHLVPVESQGDSRLLTTGQPLYWDWAAGGRQMLIHTGFSGDDARLAFIHTEGDGSGDNIADPGFFQAPGISADGRYWAYAEASRGISRVVIAGTASEERHQERHAGLVAMGWSPTANQLAFISSATATGTSFVGPLRLMDAQTGDVKVLSRDTVLAFFWSPDGRYIAYISLRDDEDGDINVRIPEQDRVQRSRLAMPVQQRGLPLFNLVVVDVNTGEGRQLTRFRPTPLFVTQFLPFFDQYALSHRLWSPASDALVLPMDEDGVNQIVVVFLSGQTRTLVEGSSAFWSHQ
ncbi:MAG TPA: hypothetical protein VF177_03255 [Anaerolineae bacterium]